MRGEIEGKDRWRYKGREEGRIRRGEIEERLRVETDGESKRRDKGERQEKSRTKKGEETEDQRYRGEREVEKDWRNT